MAERKEMKTRKCTTLQSGKNVSQDKQIEKNYIYIQNFEMYKYC